MSELALRAQAALAAGNLPEAEALYRAALQAEPAEPLLHRQLALLLWQKGEPDKAEIHIAQAIRLAPEEAYLHQNQALLLTQLGRCAEAAEAASRAIQLKPDYALAFFNRGSALGALSRFDEAIADYKNAAALGLRDPALFFSLGHALAALGQNEDAVIAYERAIVLNPDYIEAITNRGILLKDMGRRLEALAGADRAIALNPGIAQSHNMRATILYEMRRFEEAIKGFETALTLRPDYAKAWLNFGNLWGVLGRYERALAAYEKAISLDAQLPNLAILRLHAAMQVCDWTDFEARSAAILADVDAGRPVQPFALLALPSSPAQQKHGAETFTREKCPPVPSVRKPGARKPGRLRIAYVANVFREHAVSQLITDMLERHDRETFEIIGISHGLNDNSAGRAGMIAACEHFYDLQDQSDLAIAKRMADLGVDIAIELDGYTEDARPGILSHRPAPVQAQFLGYPGTLGAPFIDYIIGDNIITPPEHAAHFSEKIVRLPHAYQPNSIRPDLPLPSRAAAGLPETGFVFGCFNNSFKITPPVFALWMRLLKRVPDSVLWLLVGSDAARANLAAHAQRHGIDPARVIFAPRTDFRSHLARQGLMDLFLDTFFYGAHTTASDALWSGVPIVTMLGETFAARVPASLLTAAGLPELITKTPGDYEELAVALANSPQRLFDLKTRLRISRVTAPLFDAARFARHLESAYREMWNRHEMGQEPEGFAVPTLTP